MGDTYFYCWYDFESHYTSIFLKLKKKINVLLPGQKSPFYLTAWPPIQWQLSPNRLLTVVTVVELWQWLDDVTDCDCSGHVTGTLVTWPGEGPIWQPGDLTRWPPPAGADCHYNGQFIQFIELFVCICLAVTVVYTAPYNLLLEHKLTENLLLDKHLPPTLQCWTAHSNILIAYRNKNVYKI